MHDVEAVDHEDAEVAEDVHGGLDEVRHGAFLCFSLGMLEPARARGVSPDGPREAALARVGGVGG